VNIDVGYFVPQTGTMNLEPVELLNHSQFVLPYAKLKNPQCQVDLMLFLLSLSLL
jgi:hypothetical protein